VCAASRDARTRATWPILKGTWFFDYLPESLMQRIRNLQDFARVLVLDKWAGNADERQVVFTKPATAPKYSVTLCCDFSYVVS
jgi:hypothetical protein